MMPIRVPCKEALRQALVALLVGLVPAHTWAAGMFLAPRGVRPLARGGSYVAGADDVNALSYNPAGLGHAQPNVLVDAAMPIHSTRFTRSVYGDGNYEAPVTGSDMGMPSPTLGVTHDFGLVPGLVFGLGVAADYPLMQNWPDADDGLLAPQRYSINNFDGTAITKINAGMGWAINEYVSVGAAFHLLAGSFSANTTISTCDGTICTQPENPDYDAAIQMQATGIAVPGASLGVQLTPAPWVRLGLAWETGYAIDSQAALRVRLPSAAMYDRAAMDPEEPQGRVSMRLPQQFRAGIEVRPDPFLRAEASFIYEPWSVHDRVDLTFKNTSIQNLLGLKNYELAPISLVQGFRDTWSVRLGGEWKLPVGEERPVTARLGAMYEPSAIPGNMLTPMTVDLDKVMAAVGLHYQWDIWHVEATYAHMFMLGREVTDSQITQTNPTRPAWDNLTPIGNGTYEAQADLLGVGVRVDI